jgi:hypothetical protein
VRALFPKLTKPFVTLLRRAGFQFLVPVAESAMPDWWLHSRERLPKDCRRGFDSFVLLVSWLLWRERNDRVFNSAMKQATQLSAWIMEEGL